MRPNVFLFILLHFWVFSCRRGPKFFRCRRCRFRGVRVCARRVCVVPPFALCWLAFRDCVVIVFSPLRKDALRQLQSAATVDVLWLFNTLEWAKIATCEAMLVEPSRECVPALWLFLAQRFDLDLHDVEATYKSFVGNHYRACDHLARADGDLEK